MKNLLKSIGFFSGLYLIIVLCSILCRTKGDFVFDKTSVRIKTDEIAKEKDDVLDVLFLGDSVCYSSFSPQILWEDFGITSYVCASSAQRLCDGYAILKSASETQNFKVVVLETTCLYRSIEIEQDNDDFVLNIFNKKLPLFTYHSDWKEIADRAVKIKSKLEEKSIKGYIGRKNVIEYDGGEYMVASDKREAFPAVVDKYLNDIKTLCDKNNMILLLVSSPSPRNWNYERYNAVSDWAKSNAITYVDLNVNKNIGIDWKKDTKDAGDHLNNNGAYKVSKYLGKYLKDNYDIEDRRGNAELSNWIALDDKKQNKKR